MSVAIVVVAVVTLAIIAVIHHGCVQYIIAIVRVALASSMIQRIALSLIHGYQHDD